MSLVAAADRTAGGPPRAGQESGVLFFSSRAGCLPSIVLSIGLTLVVVLVLSLL